MPCRAWPPGPAARPDGLTCPRGAIGEEPRSRHDALAGEGDHNVPLHPVIVLRGRYLGASAGEAWHDDYVEVPY
jgi:hypothetical protein